jgi:hypothetical protein
MDKRILMVMFAIGLLSIPNVLAAPYAWFQIDDRGRFWGGTYGWAWAGVDGLTPVGSVRNFNCTVWYLNSTYGLVQRVDMPDEYQRGDWTTTFTSPETANLDFAQIQANYATEQMYANVSCYAYDSPSTKYTLLQSWILDAQIALNISATNVTWGQDITLNLSVSQITGSMDFGRWHHIEMLFRDPLDNNTIVYNYTFDKFVYKYPQHGTPNTAGVDNLSVFANIPVNISFNSQSGNWINWSSLLNNSNGFDRVYNIVVTDRLKKNTLLSNYKVNANQYWTVDQYINGTPDWICNNYETCVYPAATAMCNNVTDLNNTGYNYTGNYSEFTPQSCSYCTPSWSCNGYEVCPSTSCNSVTDLNTCNQSYSGNYSEFSPQYCATCGNNIKDVGETCDGSALNGATCQSQGFSNGTLLCNINCLSYNTGSCYNSCATNWVCTSYASCISPATTASCNAVLDSNYCGNSYSGDYTEFARRTCSYTNSTYKIRIQNNVFASTSTSCLDITKGSNTFLISGNSFSGCTLGSIKVGI